MVKTVMKHLVMAPLIGIIFLLLGSVQILLYPLLGEPLAGKEGEGLIASSVSFLGLGFVLTVYGSILWFIVIYLTILVKQCLA